MIPQSMIDMLNSGIRYAKAMTSMEDIIRKMEAWQSEFNFGPYVADQMRMSLDLIQLAHEEMSRESFIVEFEEGSINYDHRTN